ncbi:HD-GYP domain-containing protein [Paraliobacillus quinghaiensis]|uniref:HD-GYP domain-containing protein n=1 Tax=Paraliobacillus quinghaiensis TaxID=470815 RepID=UPI000E3CCE50|nr:HD-GYP domain-containing protein [Paraliobacillus quinghaiensis]
MSEKDTLLQKLFRSHNNNLNKRIMQIGFIYIVLSIFWNFIFHFFDLQLSRANLSLLLTCIVVWFVVYLTLHLSKLPTSTMNHIVLLFVIFTVICLFFGSGFTESWSYFLLLPIITSLYGDRNLSIIYSIIGLICLIILNIYFQQTHYIVDAIDFSNRILLYIIVATFSYLLLNMLFSLYKKQVNTVIQSMETTIEQVVQSFIVAVEAKDQYTFGHSERVSDYAQTLAKNIPEFNQKNKLKRLRLSGLIHDIGKINIPEYILTKPSGLTDEEFEQIKTHTTLGAQMIEKVEGLEGLKDGVLYHHEKWDGTGYPTGAKGKEIPLSARILCIADAFDAMTSSRSYREALPIEEAFQRIEMNMGTQFDPGLAKAFESSKREFAIIYRRSHNPFEEFEKLTDLF